MEDHKQIIKYNENEILGMIWKYSESPLMWSLWDWDKLITLTKW